MTKLQELTKAIQEAVPENIMAPQYGSYVTGDGLHNAKVIDVNGNEITVIRNGSSTTEKIILGEGYHCFDREIRLADVLLAWSRKNAYSSEMPTISFNGGFYKQGNIFATWSLEQNDLTLQSEATINYLHRILCK